MKVWEWPGQGVDSNQTGIVWYDLNPTVNAGKHG